MTDIQNLKLALSSVPILPVLTIDRAEDAAPLAGALLRGGLTAAEVTLRTPAALPAISAMREAAPQLLIGAGTIVSPDDVTKAKDAGAQFLVSPGMSPPLVEAMLASKIAAIPGTATASEAMTRKSEGFELLKLFPATQIGGVDLLKALSAPLPDIQFIPTGGINADTAAAFLALRNVMAVGGSWMVRSGDVSIGDWSGVEETARAAVKLGSAS